LWHTTEKNLLPLYPATEEKLMRCGIQWKKICEPSCGCCLLYPTTEKTCSVVSYNRGKPSPLYPTMQEMLLHCIPQWQKKLKT
jgi:hypothetical protein